MLILGFCIGFGFGIGLCIWQRVQLNAWFRWLPQLFFQRRFSPAKAPLIPHLQHEIQLIKLEQQSLEQKLQICYDILESAPIGYLQVDDENQLLWCNQQARELLGLQKWQPGEIRLLLELVRSYELDRLIEKARDRQQIQVREWIFHPTCEDATAILEVKTRAVRATSLPLPEGRVAVYLEDCQPLLEITQVRDRAFSDLAHELRTPLTSIRLVIETLQTQIEAPLDRWLNRLLKEIDRLIGLVQSSLDLNQLETGGSIRLHRKPLELRSLINTVWESLEPIAQKHNLKLVYVGPENLWVNADPQRMHQVFLNLLDNSVKYSPPNTNVRVEAKVIPSSDINKSQTGNLYSVEINIIDSGAGFTQNDLPHIFERFYRGDEARSRSYQAEGDKSTDIVGTGLGLAIVKQIILSHKGKISAMNHPESGGAWLKIELLGEEMADFNNTDYI